jgi:hypothetical protein
MKSNKISSSVKIVILPVLALFLGTNAVCQVNKGKAAIGNNAKDAATIAQNDFNANKAKYYVFGIAAPKKDVIERIRKYGVSVISKGCTSTRYYEQYNSTIDGLVYGKYKIKMSDLLSNKR